MLIIKVLLIKISYSFSYLITLPDVGFFGILNVGEGANIPPPLIRNKNDEIILNMKIKKKLCINASPSLDVKNEGSITKFGSLVPEIRHFINS